MTFGLRVDKDLILKKNHIFICLFQVTINSTLPNTTTLYLVKKKVSSPAERWQEMCSQHIRVKLTTKLSLLESMSIILTTKGQL